jgi:hypothetical protein
MNNYYGLKIKNGLYRPGYSYLAQSKVLLTTLNRNTEELSGAAISATEILTQFCSVEILV